ncbi:Bifunctional arginine demethylase and lysyl-hydroxylase JMJD6 [Rhynchospora pubera]|uniref:Bifunctional arginine demethylase and lysyl-hydroxylase JMJD6 n=1 Tax=Rhynchospora pubera TaxID=906938 RepID=A0AAV8ELM2_9POAL|nr:Bifunctional arginine demethylase and lysyl-hydroxylase JMJD6 [Rhynchospora pubera]
MAPTIGGAIERVDGRDLTYDEFVERYMKPNLPVVLTGLTDTWRSRTDWVDNSDPTKPNLSFFSSLCSSSVVQVADCNKKEYSEQKRVEMTVADFIRSWVEDSSNGANPSDQPESCRYLKDWHFVKEYPNYCAYSTPTFFMDDWLNIYLDSHALHRDTDICPHQNEANCADYRFVYMGPKGTWTPLHADVFRSYSWSANVCGKKHWLLLPPSQSHLLLHRNGKSSIYSVYDVISELQFPGFKKTVWLECTQESGEIIFVPSGWYHEVHNVEDTISINHNWFNGYNLSWVWNLLLEDYKIAKEYIEDIRDISDDFESLCQRNLAANTGMNLYDFFIFITRFALANIIELHHVPNSKIASHLVHNLASIQDIASKMTSQEAFSAHCLRTISSENYDAFSDVAKAFEEKKFHELCEAVLKTYRSIVGEHENFTKFETRNGNKESCFSVNCRKDNCNFVAVVKGLVNKISGPEDLIYLIDRFMESTLQIQ